MFAGKLTLSYTDLSVVRTPAATMCAPPKNFESNVRSFHLHDSLDERFVFGRQRSSVHDRSLAHGLMGFLNGCFYAASSSIDARPIQ